MTYTVGPPPTLAEVAANVMSQLPDAPPVPIDSRVADVESQVADLDAIIVAVLS